MKRLSGALRARFTVGRIALAVVLAGGFLVTAALLEKEPAGAPGDHAARLVPANALVYLHAAVDRRSRQWERARDLLRRVPALARLRNRLLRSLTGRGGPLDLARDVDPWLGDEAAFALLPARSGQRSTGTARSLILLEVSDRPQARAFLSRAAGRRARTTHRGTTIRSYGGLATAFLGPFLAIGQVGNVRAAIDARRDGSASLVRDPTFRRARSRLPDRERLLFGYASRDGLRGVLLTRSGLIGRLAALANDPGLRGAALALQAQREGARLDFAAALRRGARRSRARRFAPRLLDHVPGDAAAYLGSLDLDRMFERAFALAGGPALPPAGAFEALKLDLGAGAGARLRRAFSLVLRHEAALFVTSSSSGPVVTLMIDDVDQDTSAELLTRIRPLLVEPAGRPSESGQVPVLRPRQVAGAEATTLQIRPALELTYSVFDNRLAVSTSPVGIRQARSARSSIRDREPFAGPLGKRLDRVTSVVFLDPKRLLALGERVGLSDTAGYAALRSSLLQVRALGAVTSSRALSKTAEIFIEVP